MTNAESFDRAEALCFQCIPGWFDFEEVYDRAVARAEPGSRFVEVGCWLGRSTAYLARRIKESGKSIQLHAVDTWEGTPGVPAMDRVVRHLGGSVYGQFLENLRRAGVRDVVSPMRLPSHEAARHFSDGSLDFVFLDAAHSYYDVRRDLEAWVPKLKEHGALAGHDYQPAWPDVVRAVQDFFAADSIETVGACFWVGNPARASRPHRPALMDNSTCVILVPVAHHIEPDCESSLRALEARGYSVRRVWGYAAIDQARSQMATDALAEGFEELMWIDADVAFAPEAVDRLRSHELPVLTAIYPKKRQRALACFVLPGTTQITFGIGGGLIKILYGATGFLLTRREVYAEVERREKLPTCNTWAGRPVVPYFLPMVLPIKDGHWYLGEDFAFFERLRRCGYKIYADTTTRLWHIGARGYSWEEAGADQERYATYHFHLPG